MSGLSILTRRRTITPPPPLDRNSYIMDAPLLWLDGIDNGGYAESIWYDHAKGLVFNNHGAIWSGQGWFFNGSSYLEESKNLMPAWSPYGTKGRTLEVVADFSKAKSVQPILITSKSGMICHGKSGSAYVMTSGGAYNTLFPSSASLTYTAIWFPQENTARGLENGEVLGIRTDTSAWGKAPVAYIGASGTKAYFFEGTIYAIRFHDRILTDAELAYNMGIDAKRFNLEF